MWYKAGAGTEDHKTRALSGTSLRLTGSAFYGEKNSETAWGSAVKSTVLDWKCPPWVPGRRHFMDAASHLSSFSCNDEGRLRRVKIKSATIDLNLQVMDRSCPLSLLHRMWVPSSFTLGTQLYVLLQFQPSTPFRHLLQQEFPNKK